MRFAFIRDLAAEQSGKPRNERIPLALMCEVLEVSRGGYYAWEKRTPSAHQLADEELSQHIVALHRAHEGRLGIERMVVELAKAGDHHSPKRVRRLARAAGLESVHPRPYKTTTIRDKSRQGGLIDLVERDFVPDGPDEIWYTDITYIRTWAGWAYLAVILDGHTREVVGQALAGHMRTSLVTDALKDAITRRRPPIGQCVIHSDRGSQYTSSEFRNLAFANGIIPSVGHTGICYDNAMAESFNATFKKELIHLHTWPSITKLRTAVFDYIETYYNRRRPHSALGGLTPHEKGEQTRPQLDTHALHAA
ncbi:IS3 family transposase [Pseudactinotalea sp. HY158]|uniref:IS3 family transposase n=1 Tax=Pseudactinotalea sp. HY158 TaxID=2654547 RepID=UPI001892140C|nr:IS3 family transposase [Pseudactinotalea sp. HY158]